MKSPVQWRRVWNTFRWILASDYSASSSAQRSSFYLTCETEIGLCFCFASGRFSLWDRDRVGRGRDAISLVRWPAVYALHHVPRHHPSTLHPERNQHPEIHEVRLTGRRLCVKADVAELLSPPQCAGDAGCYVPVYSSDCQILPDGQPHSRHNSRAQRRVSNGVLSWSSLCRCHIGSVTCSTCVYLCVTRQLGLFTSSLH